MRQVPATIVAIAIALVAAGARAGAQPGASGLRTLEVVVTPDRLDRLEAWLKAIDRHDPGEIDDATNEVGQWTNDQLRGLWVDIGSLAALLRNLRLNQFAIRPDGQGKPTPVRYRSPLLERLKTLACAAAGQLADRDCVEMHATQSLDDDLVLLAAHARAERDRTGDVNYVLKRAALLHADIAMLQPHALVEPFSEPVRQGRTLGPRSWRIDISDGRSLDVGLTAVHWDIARLALDHVRPPKSDKPAPERDAMVRAWYRATAAWMQFREDHDTLHLEHARQIFPDDAELQFLSGCQRETYASPAIQAAARSVTLPTGLTVGIESERAELRQAEGFFRRAIALRPDIAEAHLHLGRVLALTGRHAEAAA